MSRVLAHCASIGVCLRSGLCVGICHWKPHCSPVGGLWLLEGACTLSPSPASASRVSLSRDLGESGEIRNVNRKWIMKLPERCEVGVRWQNHYHPQHPPPPTKKTPNKQKNLEENSKNIFFCGVQGEEAALQTLLWFRQRKRQELCRAEENFSRKNAIELRGRKI